MQIRVLSFFLVFSTSLCFGQNLKLEHVRTYNGHLHGVRKVVFSPSNNHFATGGTRGEVFVWNLDASQGVKKLEGHFGSVTDLGYSTSGKFIISTGDDGQIKVWNTSSGECTNRLILPRLENGQMTKAKFALLSEIDDAVFYGVGQSLYRFSLVGESNKPTVIYTDPKDEVVCGVVSPNGKEIIIAAGIYLIALNPQTGELIREYNTGSCKVNALEISKDGKRVLTWCENARVDVRVTETFYLKTSFRAGIGARKFSNISITEDQNFVVTGDHASRFNVWDLAKKKIVLDQSAGQGTVLAFDVNTESNYLLSASLDKSVKLWKIVPDVIEEDKGKNKKKGDFEIEVDPEVEIIQYDTPIEDVPQIEERRQTPVETKVIIAQTVPDSSMSEAVAIAEEDKLPARSVLSVLPERKENRRVKPIRKEHKLQLTKNKLVFEIWDAQVIDGDIVSIFVGDECIVKEYSITAVKKRVEFDASKYKRVYIYLHAHNLGTLPPNTVTMTVSDGVNFHEVELRSDLSGSAALELTFVDSMGE